MPRMGKQRKDGYETDDRQAPDWMRTERLRPTNGVFDLPQKEIGNLFNF